MRCLATLVFILAFTGVKAQEKKDAYLNGTLPGKAQPEYFLDKAEKNGWIERVSERSAHSSTFIAPDGKRIAYSSISAVNYKDETGKWKPVDIRPHYVNGNWEAKNQPYPLVVNSKADISFYPEGSMPIEISSTVSINGVAPSKVTGRKDGLFVWFDEIVPGVSKQIEFRNGCFKYNYVLDQSPAITGNDYIITEKLILPGNLTIAPVEDNEGETLAYGIISDENVLLGGIHKLVCYDATGKALAGNYTLTESGVANEYTLEFHISKQWLSAAQFPVVIDPLVTGPTTTWAGGIFPSCFFPAYYGDDSIQITVPAAITVTDLLVTSSYYATGPPFSTTIMADGRMYFSTNCNQSTVFQVQAPNGQTGGTAYLEDYDLNSPLMCCMPQNCNSFTFWLKMHLSRTTNGAACNTTHCYYTTATMWPFSAYVEGYTPESYSSELSTTPATVCADVCQVTANIFAHYGVPPFTYTHPWSGTTVVFGNAVGCNQANYMKQLPLDIPNCPNYCDPSTSLAIPPPVVTDACGTLVSGYNPSYNLNIKPVPVLTTTDTTVVCSNQPFNILWSDCLGGATVNWGGNGTGGTGLLATDTIINNGNTPVVIGYVIAGSLNGCAAVGDTTFVLVYPYVTPEFSFSPEPPIVHNVVSFTDNTQYNGNNATGWLWTFGDTLAGSLMQNPEHIYTEPGIYTVCMLASTQFGCSDTICKEILVIPADLILPNVISPNGDGSNDALFFQYLDQYPTNKLTIFNRWGNLIYEKDNYTNDWKAEGVSDGAYYYVLTLPGDKNYGQFLHVMRLK